MADPISNLPSILGPTPFTPGKATPNTGGSVSNPDAMGKDTFLKLLVAQLKYQDPTKPTDSSQFMAQTAQFTTVEKLEEVAKLNTELLAAQRVLGASSMLGRTVSYTDAAGNDVSGVVGSARMTADGTVLKVGTAEVPLSSVREVRAA